MANWTVDDSEQRTNFEKNKHIPVPAPSMRKYYDWKNVVMNKNQHPKIAAEEVGDMHYEQLSGKLKGQFTIRLSQEHRAAFTMDDTTKVVSVFRIGGHYP